MKRRSFVQIALGVAVAATLASAQAQTVLRFSHTDQPGGTRRDRPLFAKRDAFAVAKIALELRA